MRRYGFWMTIFPSMETARKQLGKRVKKPTEVRGTFVRTKSLEKRGQSRSR